MRLGCVMLVVKQRRRKCKRCGCQGPLQVLVDDHLEAGDRGAGGDVMLGDAAICAKREEPRLADRSLPKVEAHHLRGREMTELAQDKVCKVSQHMTTVAGFGRESTLHAVCQCECQALGVRSLQVQE